MTDCLARLKKWTATLGVPDDHQIGFSKLNDYDPDTGKSTPTGWRTYYLFGRAEVTGDYITDATVGQDNNSGAIGQFYVRRHVQPGGRRPLRGGDRRQHPASLRHHPRRRDRLGAGHQARRSAAARRSITIGAGDPEKQLTTPGSSSWCSGRARCPRPSRRATSRSSGRRSGATRSARRVKGALVGAGLVLVFMMLLLPQERRRRGRGRALQPDAADGGPRHASAPR